MSEESWAIKTENLRKRFGRHWGLLGLDLEVPRGSIFGLLGPNGAGKTTAFRILSTLTRATEGKAEVMGFDVSKVPQEVQRRLGYLPQHPHFSPWMSALELLVFLGEAAGATRQEATRRSEALLELVGLSARKDDRIKGFSGGMVQRLGIAQALIHEPPVLLLDEPVSALDPEGRMEVFKLLEGLKDKHTVVVSSHILEDLERLCDHVAFLREGRVILAGEREQLRREFDWKRGFGLEVEGEESALDALLEALNAKDWVEAVEVREVGEGRRQLEVRSEALERCAVQLPALVAEHQVRLWACQSLQPSLEEVFMRLQETQGDDATGKTEGEAG